MGFPFYTAFVSAISALLHHLPTLLSQGHWSAASWHVRQAAQRLETRAQARQLYQLIQPLPPEIRGQAPWPEALLWVSYRANDLGLAQEVLAGQAPQAWPAFRAFVASKHQDWEGTLNWAQLACSGDQEQPEWPVAARFRARAMMERRQEGWSEAFALALTASQGRDRGMLLLEWASALICVEQEKAARDLLMQATCQLGRDQHAQTLAYANLGIACLRLEDYPAAQRALQRAIELGAQGEGSAHLSTAWRGLGGVYNSWGQLARARYAYQQADRTAEQPPHRVLALRALADLWRGQGYYDEALGCLHEAEQQQQAQGGPLDGLKIDLAAVRVLLDDRAGARSCLEQVQPGLFWEHWRVKIVQAELARRKGADPTPWLRGIAAGHRWLRFEARSFPQVLGLIGVQAHCPPWTACLSTDGPIRLKFSDVPVDLKAGSTEASLLAFLVVHNGQAAVERVLEAIQLAGKDQRAKKQNLSRVVGRLRQTLGWAGALEHNRHLIALSDEVCWSPPILPASERVDSFCEGRTDPWVTEWRSEQGLLNFLS